MLAATLFSSLSRVQKPAAVAAGGFDMHPHRGFEAITLVLEGRQRHKDSRGNTGVLGPGDVQWMTGERQRQ